MFIKLLYVNEKGNHPSKSPFLSFDILYHYVFKPR